jgi:transcriptional regulator with XRE-family HTH domain
MTMRFPIEAVPSDFGRRLASARRSRNLTQAKLAVRAGLERATIVRLEAGDRMPTANTVLRLQHAMDMLPETLVPDWPEWAPFTNPSYATEFRQRRRKIKLSLVTVAKAAGTSASTLSRFEREIVSTPTFCRSATTGRADDIETVLNDALARLTTQVE